MDFTAQKAKNQTASQKAYKLLLLKKAEEERKKREKARKQAGK